MKFLNTGAAILLVSLFTIGCDNSEEPKTNLAMEVAAKKEIDKIRGYVREGKMTHAAEYAEVARKKYGHTKVFKENVDKLLDKKSAELTEFEKMSHTAKALVKLQNTLIEFHRQTGKWPAPGEVRKPQDGWHRNTFWVVGSQDVSYDLLLVSAGADGKPGSGDELMIVWTEEDLGGYIDKQTGEVVGKTKKDRNKVGGPSGKSVGKGKSTKVMTLEELASMDKKAGYKKSESISVDQLMANGEASRRAGQPRDGEMVLSIEQIADSM